MPLTDFHYPITNFPSNQHVGDLHVFAIVVLYSDGKVGGVQVMHATWNGIDVLGLIKAISPDEYDDIQAAAKSHAEGIWSAKEETFNDTLFNLLNPKEKIS